MALNSKAQVLIVDDDEALLKLIALLVKRADMEPITAIDAGSAVQRLRENPMPDIIVLDMMLPDISGLEFLRQMRSKAMFDHLPVVILSALSDPEIIQQAYAAGADHYLTKPHLVKSLIGTLKGLLQNGRHDSVRGSEAPL